MMCQNVSQTLKHFADPFMTAQGADRQSSSTVDKLATYMHHDRIFNDLSLISQTLLLYLHFILLTCIHNMGVYKMAYLAKKINK